MLLKEQENIKMMIKKTDLNLEIYNLNYQELVHLRIMIEKEIERRLASSQYY